MRTIIAVISDTHAGHKLGLCNPDVVLNEERVDGSIQPYHPRLNSIQEYLWDAYTNDMNAVLKWAAGSRIILLHNGDATQWVKHSEHLMSTRIADHITIAVDNIKPWLNNGVEIVRFSKGTDSHVGGEGSTEILIGQQLAALYPESNISTVYHGLIQLEGLGIDYAHHGPPPGSRKWLVGNQARYNLRDFMLGELLKGNIPARILLRAHYHEWIPPETLAMEYKGVTYWSTMVLTPSYCGIGSYGHKATRSATSQTHGLVAIEVIDGKLGEIKSIKRTLDLRTEENL